MLDHLRLAVPVLPVYACERGEGCFYFEGDLLSLGLDCGARVVKLDDDGKAKPYDLYAPYDTLGTDFSDMAIKFYDKGRNTLPYLELKASPAKLLQGHNVYGSDDIEQGALEMLGLVTEALPNLCKYLDFARTEVLHLDCTYSAQLPSQSMVAKVIDYLSNISSGHAKSQNSSYANYTRWGVQNSRYLGRKAYGKFEEVQSQIATLEKKRLLTAQEVNKLNAMKSALPFAQAKLRFEARICKTYAIKNNYPTNLFKLIELQRQKPTLLQDFWSIAFKPIFDTLEGQSMQLNDDDKVLELLKSKLFTTTKAGNVSYTKANNAYDFYKTIKSDGYHKVKLSYCGSSNANTASKSLFYKKLAVLLQAGISKAHLQNLHTDKPKVIPMHRLIDLDFNNQCPPDFVAPVSRFYNPKANHLRLVA